MHAKIESAETLSWLRSRVADADVSRSGLARELCARLEWKDATGRLREMSCRKKLLDMQRRELIVLPEPRSVRPVAGKLPEITPVCLTAQLADLGRIELVCITGSSTQESRIWNALMQRHHPLGSGPLCGAQLRYLIKSEQHGWLGGLAFSAAAFHLSARDIYLGWSGEERSMQLQHVVCNSRFLILPSVQVKYLASHILGKAVRSLADDWFKHYGYRPWLLETFVSAEYAGTCYRAANWIEVGETQGRGRQDVTHTADIGSKKVWLYPLDAKQFPRLGQNRAEPVIRNKRNAEEDWATQEFGKIELDARLVQRVITVARDFYARPTANIPQACGSFTRTKAAYRLFNNKKVAINTLLHSHFQSTLERIRKESIVLAVCDSSALNYTAHPATSGLGQIGSTEDGPMGFWMHETMAFTPSGVPLGLIDVQSWARDPAKFGKKHQRKQLPIEEKESYKWLESFDAVQKVQAQCEQTQLVMVSDREADVYELFVQGRNEKAQLLVRAVQNRCIQEEQHTLWPHMAAQPAAGEVEIQVGRRENQPSRKARLTVRYAPVELKPPQSKKALGTVTQWAIWVKEEAPPEGIDALDWMLLTTVPTTTLAEACERIDWYAKRWGIEIYHRTLKSGCRIENRQLSNVKSLEACLAIDMVIAWRIMHLVHLGRELPDALCTLYFNEMEWQALMVFTSGNPIPPSEPPTLREAVRRVAQLGGFLGRKSDGDPGTQTLWLGLQRLDDITVIYSIMVQSKPPP